jgi:peptidoglycan/LPS O-acetylase OafA/YrhL
MQSRITIIQILRGIAAVMISFIHFDKGGLMPKQDLYSGFSFGWSGICTFFIISGFVLPYGLYRSNYQLRKFKDFIWKRIVRIEPPYIISILCILFLCYFFPSFVDPYDISTSKNIPAILGHFIYLNAFTGERWLNMVYWTLAVEFQFYFFVGIIFPVLLMKERFQVLLIATLLTITYFISPYEVKILPFYFNFFLMGIVLFQYLTGIVRKKFFIGAMITLILFTWWKTGLGTTLFAAWVCSMIFYYYDRNPQNRYLLFMGEISYSFYLIHGPVDMVLRKIFHLEGDVMILNIAMMLFNFSIAILLAYFFYILIEKRFRRMAVLGSQTKPI